MFKEKYVLIIYETIYIYEQKKSFYNSKVYGLFDSLAEAISFACLAITETAGNNKENVEVSVKSKFSDVGRQYMLVCCTQDGKTNITGYIVPIN